MDQRSETIDRSIVQAIRAGRVRAGGWFVVGSSLENVIAAFQARRAIETGILRTASAFSAQSIATVRDHIARLRIDIATRS